MYTALGGDELIGLTLRRENFQTKNPKCNEGESEEPTGKDGNESVYEAERVEFGRARTGYSGTGAAAPEQRNRSMHADGIEPWRTDKHLLYCQLFPVFS
ncbi:unnamed protein product [Ectocarpus sp. CCAP 1310/34]|nr:unnamed protein product [Ectocarpus sp. CCAP 1310/34]